MEALIDNVTVVRIKPNDALRVKRSAEMEQALKALGCVVSVETTKNGYANLDHKQAQKAHN
jgi:hypothetical protein